MMASEMEVINDDALLGNSVSSEPGNLQVDENVETITLDSPKSPVQDVLVVDLEEAKVAEASAPEEKGVFLEPQPVHKLSNRLSMDCSLNETLVDVHLETTLPPGVAPEGFLVTDEVYSNDENTEEPSKPLMSISFRDEEVFKYLLFH